MTASPASASTPFAPQTVLVTGGTGLVGQYLVRALRERGHTPRVLSRSAGDAQWDLKAGTLSEGALDGVDAIVHLAGAGIADARWTAARKKAIIDSRIRSTEVLENALRAKPDHTVRHFLAASAVGLYGSRGDEPLTEESSVGDDFLARVAIEWEQAADRMAELGLRVVKMRIGIVLAREGGALPEMAKTLPMGVAGVLGSGRQWYPTIHVEDLARQFVFALEHPEIEGPYHAVGPEPVRQKALMRAIVQARGGSAIYMPVPEFGLRIAFGEMADAVLMSSRCRAEKFEAAGFEFQYPSVAEQLAALYG
jgi:uncharacterized protein (TIGR01777 family)